MLVRLTPSSIKGKKQLIEAGVSMPEWDWTWDVVTRVDGDAQDHGPVLFVMPAGQSDDDQQMFSRWVHETADKDFKVYAL